MSKSSTPHKTSVIGFFNPNDYPLQVCISEHNIQFILEPKKYVVDRTGALINDPILDRYVGKGRLSRASDPKQQVDIVYLRPVNPAPQPGQQPTTFTHAVSQATGFQVRDGRVQPVAPASTAPQPSVPPPSSYNPVRAYTIEDAKKLRLIRPTRHVPEDFGAEETTGAPKSGADIPEIKYATDTGPRGHKPKALPAELVTPATPVQAGIIASLERAASVNPEDPNLLRQVASTAITEAVMSPPIPALPVTNAPIPNLPKPVLAEPTPVAAPVKMKPARVVAPPIPATRVPTAMAVLPPPQLDEDSGSGLVVEESLDIEPEQPKEALIVCPLCVNSKPLKNVGMLRRHVRRFHKEDEEQIMAPYSHQPLPAGTSGVVGEVVA